MIAVTAPGGVCKVKLRRCITELTFHMHNVETIQVILSFSDGLAVKDLAAVQELQELQVQSLGWEESLEEDIATYSSFLAWRIPWTEEPSGLQSIESQRVGHD